jgi:RHS repeat-associated protein
MYQYAVEASDPDGDPVTFALTKAPAGMMMDARGLVTWRPSSAQLGDNAVEIRADDGRGGRATQDFHVTVVPFTTSLAPQIVSTPPLAAILGQGYEYDAQATDPAGAPVAWSLDSAPAGMTVDRDQGIVRWTPTIFQLGADPVVLRVRDNQGNATTQAFTVAVRGVNVPPVITSVPPTQAYAGQGYSYAVQAIEPEHEPLTFSLPAAPARMTIDAAGVIRWTPGTADVGSTTVTLRVDDGQGGVAKQTYTLVAGAVAPNPPPVITSAAPLQATAGQTYRYTVEASDPDGDPLHFALRSFPAGMTIDAPSGFLQWTPTAAQVGANGVSVAALDPADGAGRQDFTIAVIAADQPPAITSSPVTTVTAGLVYHYDVQASDLDGDTLTYALSGDTRGLSADSLGRISGPTGSADVGVRHLVVTVADSHGTSVTQPYDLTITADTEAPQVHLSASSNPVNVGSSETFVVTATDDVGVQTLGLTVGGSPVPLDANGRATLTMSTVGQFDVAATATDAAGNVGRATTQLTVINPKVTGSPTVALTGPADGAVISAPTDVTGTASDPHLLFYKVEVAPVGSDAFTEVFRGTTSVTNGTLGKFDPTMLQDDSYVLRLTAENAGGISASTEETVGLMGNLKLGNFTLGFTDLSVPVSGIPITLTRTYDTMQANQSEDFGFGWRLDYRDVRLRTSVPKTGDEANGSFNGFRDGTRVYVTLPGGHREGFTFRPTPEFIAGTVYQANFVRDADETDNLTVTGETSNQGQLGVFQNLAGQGGAITLFLQSDGTYTNDAGIPYNPADSLFGGTYFLTTKDGTQYQIDAFSGKLQTVADRNSNTLTFTDAGISSSGGPAITFARDPQGRIVSVTDPMGHSIGYQYDANGNLVAVTDRTGNTTQFVYRTDRPHYLDHVIDPLGRTGARTEYDDHGRLLRVFDSNNQAVEFHQDPGQSSETTLDRLGNPTTYLYDERGNVVSETNARGATTTRTYDANNDLLTETDPLQHTTAFSYDGDGNLLSRTDPLGNVYRNTYGPFGLLLTSTDPLGNTTTNTYDQHGNRLTTTDAAGNTTTSTYNAAGEETSTQDPGGNITHYRYDNAGHRTEEIEALGHVTSFTFDANGRQLTQTITVTTPAGPRALLTSWTYDANGNTTSLTDAENHVTRYEYDSRGEQTAAIDALGRRTESHHDDQGNLIETVFPDGLSTHFAFDADGNRTDATDRAGRSTHVGYDTTGLPTRMVSPADTPGGPPGNPTIGVEYDLAGRVTAIVGERNNRTEFDYDAAGHQTRVRDPLGNETGMSYDAAGHEIARTDPLGHTTRTVYDALGRAVETIFPDGTASTTTYDSLGNVVAETDQAGHTTRFEYDALKRLTAVIDALGQRTEYAYDEAGNLIRQTDANGHVTRFEYDGVGRRTAVVRPLGQRSETVYDAVGNVIRTTDFNGATITYDYDSNNLLTARHLPDGTSVTFTYTPSGQRRTVTDGRGTTGYTYDARDRLLSRTEPDGTTITHTYDPSGNVATVTTPAGTTAYRYDGLSRLTTVTDAGGGVTAYSYDSAGNLIGTSLPNHTSEVRQYDDLNRLTAVETTGPGGGILANFRYTLDADGNPVGATEQGGRTVNYAYDPLNRLVTESVSDPGGGKRTIGYTYDAVGNRLTRDDSVEGETADTFDANDRLQTETLNGVVTSYTYDNNGNTVSRSSGATDQASYQWDFQNHLIGADVTDAAGTRHLAYQYDADGLRVASSVNGDVTRYLIDTTRSVPHVVQEYRPGGGVSASYVYGLDLISQDRAGRQSFYGYDGYSGVRLLTNAGGVVTDRYAYDAFGRLLQSAGGMSNTHLYRGEQSDPFLALQYLRARYYDPAVGRFASVDPFDGVVRQPVSLRRYLYANANPVRFSDTSGAFSLLEFSLAFTVVAILATIQGAGLSSIANSLGGGSFIWPGRLHGASATFGLGAGVFELSMSPITLPGDRSLFAYSSLLVLGGGGISASVAQATDQPFYLQVPRIFLLNRTPGQALLGLAELFRGMTIPSVFASNPVPAEAAAALTAGFAGGTSTGPVRGLGLLFSSLGVEGLFGVSIPLPEDVTIVS